MVSNVNGSMNRLQSSCFRIDSPAASSPATVGVRNNSRLANRFSAAIAGPALPRVISLSRSMRTTVSRIIDWYSTDHLEGCLIYRGSSPNPSVQIPKTSAHGFQAAKEDLGQSKVFLGKLHGGQHQRKNLLDLWLLSGARKRQVRERWF